MWPIRSLHLWLGAGHLLGIVNASITVYYADGQNPFATTTAGAANYTGAAAYNPTTLQAPPIPTGQTFSYNVPLQNGGTPGLSIAMPAGFFGFSVEMSVVNQVVGKNSSIIQVPFLNLMANLQQRAGRVMVRVGGNTQDTATLVPSTPDGKILEKDIAGASNPTQTPPLIFTPDLLQMLRAVSSFVDVRWFLGIPFNDTSNWRLGIVESGQTIIGDYLLGFQAGNEPDLYARHGHRPANYSPTDYFNEFGQLVQALQADSNVPNPNQLIGPNIASADWQPDQVWSTGFIQAYTANLAYLAVEHYPTDNCFAQFGVGSPEDPQALLGQFLTHSFQQSLVAPYLDSTALAQQSGKQFLMMETNTASCGGFAGLSDAFAAALWGLDFAMQMAYSNFTGALFHVGGQSVFYNPFTPPPTNQSTFHQWTVGPIYYSALVMAEAMGPSNNTQVLDLNANGGSAYTPAYAFYENGNPVRLGLFNFNSDPTGASAATVSVTLNNPDGSSAMPSTVTVKYLLASSVVQKYNFTWANQTFGDIFQSDGRPVGTEQIETVNCNGACTITVPAPGFALVFLTSDSETETAGAPSATFATTAVTKLHNTASVDPTVLATSNGHTDMEAHLGSTSPGSVSGTTMVVVPGFTLLAAVVAGLVVARRGVL